MPHKDMKGGNPVAEENTESFTNNMRGIMQTSLSSCRFDYARDLSGSASDRIILENMFKFGDYATRRMAGVVSKLEPVVERCEERVLRSYGVVTAQQVMTYLTDPRKTEKPMTREEAHELTAKLATKAYDSKINFSDIVMQSEEILSRFSRDDIIEITNPLKYIGQSKDIVKNVFERYHGKKTLSVENVF
jgi:adenylosuccinate lyase